MEEDWNVDAGTAALFAGIIGAFMGLIELAKTFAKRGDRKEDKAERADVAAAVSDHGPCNEAVDRLTEALHEEIAEQRAFRVSFEKWMAFEEGRRDALRQTGEFPAPSER